MFLNQLDTPTLYWKPPGRDGVGGYLWDHPEEIMTRWDFKSSLIYNESGGETESNAIVWTNKDIELGSYLWKGTLKEVTDFKKPSPDLDFTSLEYKQAREGFFDLDVLDLASIVLKVDIINPLSACNALNFIRKVYLA